MVTSIVTRWRLVGFLAISLAACGGQEAVSGDSHAGPTARLVDSTILVEADSVPLGAYSSFFLRSPRGDVMINDMQQARLIQFDPTGAFRRTIGTRGEGPGEFQLPGPLGVLPGDTTLMVFDVNRQRASIFDLSTGEYLSGLAVPFQDVGTNWTVDGTDLVMAINASNAIMARWRIGSAAMEAVGEVPAHMLNKVGARMAYGRSEVVVTDSLVLVLLPTEPGVNVHNRAMQYLGYVPVMAVRREGEPADLATRQRAFGRDASDLSIASSTVGFHRLQSGMIVLVHLDMTVRAGEGRGTRADDFRLYVTLLSEDLSKACIDGSVNIRTDVAPIPSFVGDTMFVLSRQVQGDDRVRSVVYAVVIDSSSCDWTPTGGVQPRVVDTDAR